LRADRVTREIAPPPVFGKENRADSKHESAFFFEAMGGVSLIGPHPDPLP
jgi:hypothetical protein